MRSVLLYLVLVGAPLLGLFGILEVGERIVPPRSISGTWILDEAFLRGTSPACGGLEFGDEIPVLRISQSGVRAELAFGDRTRATLSASLQGDSLLGTGQPSPSLDCPAGVLRLRAHLVGGEANERLSGTLTTDDCSRCPLAAFVAIRRPEEVTP